MAEKDTSPPRPRKTPETPDGVFANPDDAYAARSEKMARARENFERNKNAFLAGISESAEGSAERVAAWVRCVVGNHCDRAETALKASTELSTLRLETKRPSKKSDLSGVRATRPYVGSGSMSRLLLFGTNDDIVRTAGTFVSKADRVNWETISNLPPEKRERNPYYQKLVATRGKSIEIPPEHPIDFGRNLRELWELKIRRYGDRNPAIREFYETRIRPFSQKSTEWKRMELAEYEAGITRDIAEIRSLIGTSEDFKRKIGKAYGLKTERELRLATKLYEHIGAKELITLSTTEIMDATAGEFNLQMLDAILKNGGVEYLMHVPALGDPYVSYGPYQHTKYSVGGRVSEGKTPGAQMADKAFTGGVVMRAPKGGDVTIENLPVSLHHKAAYLLTLQNVAMTVRMMPETYQRTETRFVATFDKRGKPKKQAVKREIVRHPLRNMEHVLSENPEFAASIVMQYFAAAHNKPQDAYYGLLDWLEAYEKKGLAGAGPRLKPYIDEAVAPTAAENAERAKKNYEAAVTASGGKLGKLEGRDKAA